MEGQSVLWGPEPRETRVQREHDPEERGPRSGVHAELPRLPGGRPYSEIEVAGVASLEYEILKVKF